MGVRRVIAVLMLALALAWSGPVARADVPVPAPGVRPVLGAVVRDYDAPEPDWLPGHRGVDLAGELGEQVRAAASGVVSFAGLVAGRNVLVIDHGAMRTTYEPVRAFVDVGQRVTVGEVIGALEAGHCDTPCLHWGLKEADRYRNPLSMITKGRVRLVGEQPLPPPPIDPGPGSGGPLRRPAGPITSGFGMRLHPVAGIWVLHDGTDFGLGCGTPIAAAAAGVVSEAGDHGGYGLAIVVDHGTIDGRRVKTMYAHSQGITVRVGERVAAGQTLGVVGSTGLSTGCHLHFMTIVDGRAVDPLTMT